MGFDETAHQSETDAKSRLGMSRRAVYLHEEIEYMRQLLRRDADSGVANAHEGLAVFLPQGQPQIASRLASRS